MSLSGKKLLVIGGASQHSKLVEAAHRLNVTVHVADYLPEAPAKKIADQAHLIDVKDIEGLVALCEREKFDGAIVTSLEACVLPYQKVCSRMGYPCFGTEEQYGILTNKFLFKECCAKYGVDTIPSYTEADIYSDEAEYPIFIKPVDSRGSRGQAICRNREEAVAAIEKAKAESASGTVLIEKYMKDCPDFTVAYMVLDGEPVLVRTGDRFEGERGSGLENLCIASVSPSRYTEKYLETAHHNVVAMLKGMGLQNAPVFFQGFIDGDAVRFYDPGLRFAGGEYERLLYHATGVDILEELIKYALGCKPENKPDHSISKMNGKYSVQLDPTLRAGKIAEIQGLDKIMACPAVISNSQRYFAGDEVPEANDLRQRFSEFGILSNSLEDLINDIRFVQNNLRIIDTENEDMVVCPFDTGLLED